MYGNDISSGAKDKQAIQRGAEQTSNSARRGTNKQLSEAQNIQAIQRGAEQTSNSARRRTYKQFAVPLDKQAPAFLTNFSYRGKNFQRCWINQQVSLSQPYWRH